MSGKKVIFWALLFLLVLSLRKKNLSGKRFFLGNLILACFEFEKKVAALLIFHVKIIMNLKWRGFAFN